MNARRLVRRGQKRAEVLMVDTCRIRPILGVTTNPPSHPTDPGGAVVEYGLVVYEGKCKLQNSETWPSNPDAGEHRWTLVPTWLHLPVAGSGAVGVGHFVELLTSVDPANVGRQFRVRSSSRKSLMTAARFLVEEVAE